MPKFKTAAVDCVIQDPPHSRKAGTYPSGNVATDVCERHMEFWIAANKKMAQAILAKPKKLWFLGKTK